MSNNEQEEPFNPYGENNQFGFSPGLKNPPEGSKPRRLYTTPTHHPIEEKEIRELRVSALNNAYQFLTCVIKGEKWTLMTEETQWGVITETLKLAEKNFEYLAHGTINESNSE